MSHPSTAQGTPARRPAWLIVTIREIVVKVTDRAFIIGTLTTLGLIVAGFAIGFLVSGRAQTTDVVVTTPDAAALARSVEAVAKQSDPRSSVHVSEASSDEAARAQVEPTRPVAVRGVRRVALTWALDRPWALAVMGLGLGLMQATRA